MFGRSFVTSSLGEGFEWEPEWEQRSFPIFAAIFVYPRALFLFDPLAVSAQSKGCSLHLTQKFSLLYAGTRSPTIFSKESAVGLILASGEQDLAGLVSPVEGTSEAY